MAGSSSTSTSRPSSSSTPLVVSPSDPTYISLLTLLSSPASSSRHLNLLPPSGLYGSIALYLARLDPTAENNSSPLDDLVERLLTSQSLWNVDNFINSESKRIHEDITQPSSQPSFMNRVYHLHLAVARAVFSKIEALLLQRNGSTGWRTQADLKRWAEQIVKASHTDSRSDHDIGLARFAIATGLVVGLGAYRQQSRSQQSNNTPSQGLNVSRAFFAIQAQWITSFHEILESHLASSISNTDDDEWEKEFVQVSHQDDTLSLLGPILLAAQVSPHLSERALSTLKPEPILTLFPRALFPLFQKPYLTISQDLDQITTPQTHVLYPLLGPLSRILAAAGENALLYLSLQDVHRILLGHQPNQSKAQVDGGPGVLKEIFNLAGILHEEFLSNQAMSTSGGSEALTNLWTSLKAFLFISIQFFDSLLDGIVEVLPSPVYTLRSEEWYTKEKEQHQKQKQKQKASSASAPAADPLLRTSNIPPTLTTILITQIETMMRLGFITFSVTNPAQAPTQVGKGKDSTVATGDNDTAAGGDTDPTKMTSNDLYDHFSTYRRAFYGSLEVVKSDLGASVELLDNLQAYLPAQGASSLSERSEWLLRAHQTIYLDASEQLISILPSSSISSQIIPYSQPYLLDATYPCLFESSHSCLLSIFETHSSNLCIDLMPYYLECLLKSFPKHLSNHQLSHTLSTIVSCISNIDDAKSYYIVERLEEVIKNPDRKLSFQPYLQEEGEHKGEWEETKLQFQLAYIDLLPYVNLVLLRSLLNTIEGWILEAKQGDQNNEEQSHKAQLCARTFKALGGMDDTARQEGVRWWLDKRESFGV
ncbi:unnamed protein product [Sympodiomycopsis kandeliae]